MVGQEHDGSSVALLENTSFVDDVDESVHVLIGETMIVCARQETFPIEIFEQIIGHLLPRMPYRSKTHFPEEYRVLQACALTCRSWYTTSRTVLLASVVFDRRKAVLTFEKLIAMRPALAAFVRAVNIHGDWSNACHLAMFPSMFVRRLPNVETLTLHQINWLQTVPLPSFYRHLSGFMSTTKLELVGNVFLTLH
ncbi:hypothetical protein AcV7_002465 [Taiwanofungus camphoratus]|nr:hypothetical protein AcV7_002465 [Antrodia cinnamomea]